MSSDSRSAAGTNESEPFDLTGDGTFMYGLFCPVTGQFETAQDYNKSFTRYNNRLVSGKEADEPIWIRATTNDGTALLDLEYIYGTSEEENNKTRNQTDRRLFGLVDKGSGFLPRDPYIRKCFGAVPGSYALQVVWMRLHNHVADIISEDNRGLDDEVFFQAACHLNLPEDCPYKLYTGSSR